MQVTRIKCWIIKLLKTLCFCTSPLEINQWNVHCFTPVVSLGYNYLPLPLTSASGMQVLNWDWYGSKTTPRNYFFSWERDIPGELRQYNGCWCPGPLRRQDINSHAISKFRGMIESANVFQCLLENTRLSSLCMSKYKVLTIIAHVLRTTTNEIE